jgi:hypothetical protein
MITVSLQVSRDVVPVPTDAVVNGDVARIVSAHIQRIVSCFMRGAKEGTAEILSTRVDRLGQWSSRSA